MQKVCQRGFVHSFKSYSYNPGQNSWDTNPIARQNEAFSLSPPPLLPSAVLTFCIQVLFQHNQHCVGERETAQMGSYNNIPKLF